MKPPVFGIVGWKNSGKTTLTARLIEEFARRGFKVAAVKHAHHGFDVDQPGRDSYSFREAGAREVAIVSARRVAVMQELRDEPEPGLDDMIARLNGPDLVLVEGFKKEAHPKIEARRSEARQHDPLTEMVANVVAIAADHDCDTGGRPAFSIDEIPAIADFITDFTDLAK